MVLEGSGAPVDDVAHIAALRAGEESSFRDLVMRYHAALVRLARVSMGSQAAAEEVASNTWRVVIRDIGGFDGRSSLKVWIFGIALNEVHAVHRRIAVPPERDGDRAAPAVHPDRFVLDGQRYTVVYLDHPKNPKEARFSERDYGRFGSYFVADATEKRPVDVDYRLWLQDGPMTVEEVGAKSADFVTPPEVSVRAGK